MQTANKWVDYHDSRRLKFTVENLRGVVEKMSPKESVEGAHTVLHTAPQHSVVSDGLS